MEFEMDMDIITAKANIFKALGHPSRLAIVEKLAQGECCVCDLVDLVNADYSTVSKHLAILKDVGVVDFTRDGKKMMYRLKVPCILRFMDCIENLVIRENEVELSLNGCSAEMGCK